MKIANRTFIVSGGSSGLGLATVQALHESGAFISVLDLRMPDGGFDGFSRVAFFKVDVTKVDQIQDAIDKTIEWAKSTRAPLGGVITCAGIAMLAKMVKSDGTPHPLKAWNKILDVNLNGTFNLARLTCQHLIKVDPEGSDEERGVIIMVSSSEAVSESFTYYHAHSLNHFTRQFEGQGSQTAYVASKGAIRSMTLPMARDLGRYGIRVNSIAPSAFATGMTAHASPQAIQAMKKHFVFPTRIGKPDEFARTVKWIIECPYVNGDTFRLSGGSRIPAKL
ncbi:putative 3-hydroxyacyl-CoA dehydrogenase [Sistotremastrum suecicum HHB10207 ss-3]|uniref:Putative 3-hydroxyacyl-CoA dehydrogenase n=1 Tax=Sistotremastrum suecicum HHB10207 ss-3 TaxID=1314776 RepID=A0A166CYK1_9AGAM|nr:putative 3-hydroxyacyl-CoA dehydrogenase [Sistotremastrum suecicum HHB10207 ss-3]